VASVIDPAVEQGDSPDAGTATFYVDTRTFLVYAVILAVLTAACVALVIVASGTPRIAGGIFCVVYGVGFVATVLYIRRPRVIVRTESSGLRVGQGPEVPWGEIRGAEIRGSRPRRRILAVLIDDPASYLALLRGAARVRAQRMNSRQGTPVVIPERYLGSRFEAAQVAVSQRLAA